jgi:hypothetical protein
MTDKAIALSQIALSVLFFTGYFGVIALFLLGHSDVPPELRDIFSGLIGLLSAGGLMILQFWFSRSRQGGSNA